MGPQDGRADFETLLPTTVNANVWTIVMNGSDDLYIGTDVGSVQKHERRGKLEPDADASPSGLIGLPVRALGVEPTRADPVTLYAGTSGRGVFKRSAPDQLGPAVESSLGSQPTPG